jgi:hypothetical protein
LTIPGASGARRLPQPGLRRLTRAASLIPNASAVKSGVSHFLVRRPSMAAPKSSGYSTSGTWGPASTGWPLDPSMLMVVVHSTRNIGLGAARQQRTSGLDGIGRHLLAVFFRGVCGDVVERRGAVHHRRVEKANTARTGADQIRVASERVLPVEHRRVRGRRHGFRDRVCPSDAT